MRPLAVGNWPELAGAIRGTRAVAALLHEAGNPYSGWFFGGEVAALAAVERSLARPSSELFGERVVVLPHGGRVAGLVLAVPGAELEICRKADTLAALAEAGEERPALRERIAAARRLFLPVEKGSLYLSRIAVVRRLRGRGFGRALMGEFLRRGRSDGFRRFDLDVAAANTSAIRLYESFGFRVEAGRSAVGMRYLRMVLVDDWPY